MLDYVHVINFLLLIIIIAQLAEIMFPLISLRCQVDAFIGRPPDGSGNVAVDARGINDQICSVWTPNCPCVEESRETAHCDRGAGAMLQPSLALQSW